MAEIYVEVGKDNIVTKVHRYPFDPKLGLQTPREELEKQGVFVNEVPDPEYVVGRRAVMKYDPDFKKIYYDYIAVPLSNEQRIDAMEDMINELLMSGKLG